MRINISISEELLKKTDGYAKINSYDRSSLIAEALRRIMADSSVVERRPVKADVGGPNPPLPARGWCETHFEKGATYELTRITWEDENGNIVVDKKLVCPMCLVKYKSIGRGHLTIL